MLLIVPYWNWNIFAFNSFCNLFTFNRTILELKLFFFADFILLRWTFNRTILELKRYYKNAWGWQVTLLIVPYWNWNNTKYHNSATSLSFNRTILELKHSFAVIFFSQTLSFNRTILELKHSRVDSRRIYNRRLLIVPYWNWNDLSVYFPNGSFIF
mgnify:CR=1 FL=1